MPRIVTDQILKHLRQAGVTPQLSIIYLLLRSRIFIFGGLVMNSTIPVDGVCLANDTVGEVRELTEIREQIEVISLRDLNQEAH